MSLKSEYPLKFKLSDIVNENINIDETLWIQSRGFSPKDPQTYESCLIVSLYNEEGRFLGRQLRDINDSNIETKYTLTNNIYDLIVKTTEEDIKGIKVICEGTMDCLLLRLHGFNAYTTLGLKAFRLKRVFEEITDRCIIIFDRDDLGKKFSRKYSNKGLVYQLPFPYKDVCDYYQKDKEGFTKWLDRLMDLTLL